MAGLTIKKRIAQKLHQALQKEHNNTGRVLWRAGTRVQLGKNWFFTLHYDVIGRRSEYDKPGLRFEWINKLCGFDDKHDVNIYTSEGTLTPDGLKKRGYIGKYGQEKERLIKHQLYKPGCDPVYEANAEYNMATPAPHIRMKKPVVIGNTSLLTMKKLPGVDLFQLLYRLNYKLSTAQRIALTLGLLQAYRTQVDEFDLVHRDIKPENIMVDLYEDGRVEVNIIDYGLTVPVDSLDCMAGTPGYLPPELFTTEVWPQRSSHDLFALGCVIAELWGLDNQVVTLIAQIQSGHEGSPVQPGNWRDCLPLLFTDGPKPDDAACSLIQEVLYEMLDPDPHTRLTLENAEKAFLNVQDILEGRSAEACEDWQAPQQAQSSTESQVGDAEPDWLRPASGKCDHRFFKPRQSMHEQVLPARLPEPISSVP